MTSPAQVARLWAHDRYCAGGPACPERDQHARDAYIPFGVAAARAHTIAALGEVIHDFACRDRVAQGMCHDPETHTLACEHVARDLWNRMRQ